jgi:hypothetical protein
MKKYGREHRDRQTTVVTRSLKAYTMAQRRARERQIAGSVDLYKRAVDLDQNFAMAYARIGVQYVNEEQLETARVRAESAYELRRSRK